MDACSEVFGREDPLTGNDGAEWTDKDGKDADGEGGTEESGEGGDEEGGEECDEDGGRARPDGRCTEVDALLLPECDNQKQKIY